MEFKSIQDYSGFTFNEKKAFKERESTQWWTAQKHINEKLGADWKLIIDWPEFAKAIPGGEGNYQARDECHLLSGRTDLAFCLYETFVETLGNDVALWEPDFCEAVNEKVTKKIMRITTWNGVDHLDGYLPANKTELLHGEIVISIQPRRVTERFCNSGGMTSEKPFGYYVDLALIKPIQEGGDAKSAGAPEEPFVSIQDYSGFSFSNKKVFKEREERQWFPAQKVIHQKLGKEWKLIVDWPAFAKVIPAEGKFDNLFVREDLGFFLYEVYCKTIGDDVEKWDGDLIEAVNDKVTNKIIRITVWPVDNDNLDSYKIEIVDGVILISIQPKRLTYTFCNWSMSGYSTFAPFSKYIGNLV